MTYENTWRSNAGETQYQLLARKLAYEERNRGDLSLIINLSHAPCADSFNMKSGYGVNG